MNLYTFDPSHNPGRSAAWTVRGEAIALANAGASGLAGIILRDGFSDAPACAVPYVKNTERVTLAALCAEILVGLATRTTESGAVKPILNGTPIELFRRRMADLENVTAAGIVTDGRRRCIASIMAYGVGLDGIEMKGTLDKRTGTESAFRDNIAQELAQRLDPWAKVEAGERTLTVSPLMSEADMMKALGVKRCDGQLIHRAATAIRKHGLVCDRTKRCPGKEEWATILAELTREGADSLLRKAQTEVRAKALGSDQIIKALETLPESLTLNPRELAKACGSADALTAYLVKLTAPVIVP